MTPALINATGSIVMDELMEIFKKAQENVQLI
jgi:hypothetical protein